MIDLLKAIVDLPTRMKGDSQRISGNSMSPLGAQIKDTGAAWQTLLTEVKLRLSRRLLLAPVSKMEVFNDTTEGH